MRPYGREDAGFGAKMGLAGGQRDLAGKKKEIIQRVDKI